MAFLCRLSLDSTPYCFSSSSYFGDQHSLSRLQTTHNPTVRTLRARISSHPSELANPENALQPIDEVPLLLSLSAKTGHFEESELDMGGTNNSRKTQNEFMPKRISSIRALNHCAHLEALDLGKSYHALVTKMGLDHDKFVATSVVGMYAKCGDINSAHEMFDQCPNLDIVSWNNLMFGYAINGFSDRALILFLQIQSMEMRPSAHTFSIALSACGTLLAVKKGKQIHAQIVKMQCSSNTAVGNALLTMYSKFGMMEEVEILFQELPSRNHISWTAIITGFYRQECFEKALSQFYCMRHSEVAPNEHTFAVAFASCGAMRHPNYGTMLHALTIKNGMASGVFVGTAILDMYSALGEMGDAEKQLDEIENLSSNVPWNALIVGHIRNGKNEDAMEAFRRMLNTNSVVCDQFTCSNILKAASSLPSLATGEQIHSWVIKTKCESNVHVGSSLIEMYAKSGVLANAEYVFNKMPTRDVVSWNSMMKAYSQHGKPKKAIFLFNKMIEEGIRPTSATFLSVVSACSHSGLIEEGQEYFRSMVQDYEISAEETHYSCIVDLLGRVGRLEEARDFINNLPIEPNASIWRPLLAACRFHGNLQMAEFAAGKILTEDFRDPTVYVTLSNMYAELGRWSDVEKQRNLMKLKEVKKEPGCSWVEVNNRLSKFYSKDMKHAEMPEVYAKLKELVRQIKSIGYLPETKLVFHQGDEASKQEHILLHSEKLAVCFGLIKLSPSKPIRIFKNLRVCRDCHSAMKYISIVTAREIILRDNYRFHRFKRGCCSCGDYW